MLSNRVGVVRTISTCWIVAVLLAWPSIADGQGGGRALRMQPGSGPGRSTPRHVTPYYQPQNGVQVKQVRITGNKNIPEEKVRSHLKTRVDRIFDPARVQADVHTLISTGLFRDVRTLTEQVPGGIAVTFEVFERPTIGYVRFVGNAKVKDKVLLRESGLKVSDPLNTFAVGEGRRKLQEYYLTHGYGKAQVTVIEGTKTEHEGVAYRIHEGPLQRIWRTKFEGNTLADDRRLKTVIQSKPGILWMFKGKVDQSKIDEDVQRLTAYYRSLGYFKADVGRELQFDEKNKWLTLTFTIDEGPRYQIRDIKIIGNEKYTSENLTSRLNVNRGDYFNLTKLRRDENTLRDIYGSQGHIAADIKVSPRFLEKPPGQLDLVYEIKEGDQYRVGRIFVNIQGDQAHTRETVVLNRLSIKPGDIVDIREIRNSERRLKASQLFLSDMAQGVSPEIVVKPSVLGDGAASIARQGSGHRPGGSAYRGQSPDDAAGPPTSDSGMRYHRVRRPVVDLHVNVKTKPEDTGSAP